MTGPAQSLGSTSGGCLKGAESLRAEGPGYQVMNIGRHRFYGHPNLVRMIENAGQQAKLKKWGTLLIGDLAQPRGGPLVGSHLSHQTGLDVDIWFSRAEDYGKEHLNLDDTENLPSLDMVLKDNKTLDFFHWKKWQEEMLQFFAEQESVERIFVDAALKKQLCDRHGEKAAWLNKLRPWWNHRDHLHLRLKCPSESPECVTPEPIPPGTGCDETLLWWFTDEALKPGPSSTDAARKLNLPKACDELL